jgi:NAD(P)-dependent dehydrogenase (short-subunit alcohol dehydrogenase family)
VGSIRYSFTGEAVFVTGGSSGMGRAVARAFADAGAAVVIADVNDAGGEHTVALITEAGGHAAFVHCDVSDGPSVAAAVARVIERHGRLDAAVNAAAIENEHVPLHECDDAVFDRMQAINLGGVFHCMKYELAAMLAGGRPGAIVNIASTNSFRPQPNQPAYTASKHAVLGLTRSAAIDYARHGIRINAICPGGIDTPMLRDAIGRRGRNPDEVAGRLSLLGRFGTAEEIAQAALWLCSTGSSYTVGHPLSVDAGYLAR